MLSDSEWWGCGWYRRSHLSYCLSPLCVCTHSSLIRPHISFFMTAISNKAAKAAPLCSRLIYLTLLEKSMSACFHRAFYRTFRDQHCSPSNVITQVNLSRDACPLVYNEWPTKIFRDSCWLKFNALLTVHLCILKDDCCSVKEPLCITLNCQKKIIKKIIINHEQSVNVIVNTAVPILTVDLKEQCVKCSGI